MAVIDSLEVQIKAEASKATKSIDGLITKLQGLDVALGSISGTNLKSLADGVNELAASMSNMKTVGTADFTRLKKNIETLGTVDVSRLNMVASGLRQITNAFGKLSGVSSQATAIKDMASAISRLGYKSVTAATQNIPSLTIALKNMLTELSTAPTISRNVIDLTNSIARLASQGRNVGAATRSMSNNFSRLSSSSYSAKKSLGGLAAAFGKFYASYFMVIRAVKGMWQSIEGSMDYVETYNYFSVTMSKIGDEFSKDYKRFGYESAQAYADSFEERLNALTSKITGYKIGENGELISTGLSNLGADPEVLMNFQAKIGAVTNSVGLLGETSVNTQKALSMLSYDLSSLTNQNVEDVMSNLSSALIGQSRAVYKYGVDLTAANLKEVALEHNITKSVSAMTQAEKMQLRILSLLSQTTIAYGDMANTVNSVSNSYRIFQQQINNLKLVLGNLFLPVVQKVLPVVNGLIIALKQLFTEVGLTLYGDTWLKDLMDGISDGYAVEELEEDLEGVDDVLSDSANNAKKLKQQLQGFDELNVLTTKDDSSSTSVLAGLDFDLTDDISKALSDYESVWNKAFEGMENKAQGFAEKISKYLKPLKTTVEDIKLGEWKAVGEDVGSLAKSILEWFTKAVNEVPWKDVGTSIGEFLEGLPWLDIIKEYFKLKFSIWKAIADVWFGSFEEAPFETTLITGFGIMKFTKVGSLIGGKLWDSIKTMFLSKITAVGGLGGLLTMDVTALGSASLVTVGAWIAAAIAGGIIAWFGGQEIGKAIGAAIFPEDEELYFDFKWFGDYGFFKQMFSGYESVSDWFAIQKQAFLSMLYDMSYKSNEILKKIVTGILGIANPFYQLRDQFKTVFTYIRNYLISMLNNSINAFETFANNILGNITPVIMAMNMVGQISGSIQIPTHISIPRIPHFMEGGYIGNASLFTAGENGIPELLGTVNGRSAVAGGEEITGIKDAVNNTGETQAQLLSTAVSLLQIIAEKEFGVSDSQIFNSYNNSAKAYKNRTGLNPV